MTIMFGNRSLDHLFYLSIFLLLWSNKYDPSSEAHEIVNIKWLVEKSQ